MAREPYKLLDLFSGIGGFSLGLERTGGFKTVAVAEVDPFAVKVLADRFPDAPNVGDVTTAEYPDADFICAGFPCQDISFAGRGAGLAGSRSGLWREVVRAIRVVRPRGALLENVAALLSRGMGTVLGDLAEIGHDAEWHCIPAGSIGAPHVRDRVWIYAEPQHSDTNGIGPHREGQHVNGNAESTHKQVGLVGSLGAILANTPGAFGSRLPRGTKAGVALSRRAGGDVADAECIGRGQVEPPEFGRAKIEGPTGAITDRGYSGGRQWWQTEPDVGRVADGVSSRVDRLRALGNAVVPQIPELIGHAILSAERAA